MNREIKVTSQELLHAKEVLFDEYTQAWQQYLALTQQMNGISHLLNAKGVGKLQEQLNQEMEETQVEFQMLKEQLGKLAEIAERYEQAERGNLHAVQSY